MERKRCSTIYHPPFEILLDFDFVDFDSVEKDYDPPPIYHHHSTMYYHFWVRMIVNERRSRESLCMSLVINDHMMNDNNLPRIVYQLTSSQPQKAAASA